jgi:hypothetical protein
MKEFAVGDRIKVITDRWDRSDFIQYGKIGTIVALSIQNRYWCSVLLDHGEGYSSRYKYSISTDIEHYTDKFSMPDPEMDLDEIHLAQELVK